MNRHYRLMLSHAGTTVSSAAFWNQQTPQPQVQVSSPGPSQSTELDIDRQVDNLDNSTYLIICNDVTSIVTTYCGIIICGAWTLSVVYFIIIIFCCVKSLRSLRARVCTFIELLSF